MDIRDRITGSLQQARDRKDALAIEIWDAALTACSAPIPSYNMEEQRSQLLHNLDKKAVRHG